MLIAESENAIKWFFEIIVNRDKFKSPIFQKRNQTIKPKKFLLGNDVVEITLSIKLLEIHIDDQLNFNLFISNF